MTTMPLIHMHIQQEIVNRLISAGISYTFGGLRFTNTKTGKWCDIIKQNGLYEVYFLNKEHQYWSDGEKSDFIVYKSEYHNDDYWKHEKENKVVSQNEVFNIIINYLRN